MPAYKDEKTGKWFCKFYYTDWQGNNRQKWKRGFATKKEALAFEREFLEKQSANPDMTFQSLYELYMEDMTARLKQSTILTKKHICENHILPFFGKKPINEIKASDVRRWQNQLMNSPNGYSKTYLRLNGQDIITPPKTKKSKRKVPIPDFLCQELQSYMDTRYMLSPNERLFPATKHFLSHKMENGSKKTGVKRIRIHDIRHSHVSLSQGYFWDSLSDCLR